MLLFRGWQSGLKKDPLCTIAILYINNELAETLLKQLIHNCTKINLTKEGKDLYSENYITLVKDNKDDTNKWKVILCSWVGIILLKCPYYSKQSTTSIWPPSKYYSIFN